MEYIIVGDTEKHGECLIYTVNGGKDFAEEVLHRMLTKPTEYDLRAMQGHKNIRVKEVESKDCWWNDPFLAN